jgi:hypothetical protein
VLQLSGQGGMLRRVEVSEGLPLVEGRRRAA